MPGTKEGGAKAKAANLAKDPNYYKKIGSLGGKANLGKIVSEETGRKISETKKRRHRENSKIST